MNFPNNAWHRVLAPEFDKAYYKTLQARLDQAYDSQVIYPPKDQVFRAFDYTDFDEVKVVILGQDPYHGQGQAQGLSFSVQKGIKQPPSLINMFKELCDDCGCQLPESGSLVSWAKQGVLLLNTVLTVPQKTPNGHKGWGWETFTDRVIEVLNTSQAPVVYILWGAPAQKKLNLIDTTKHHVIMGPHPSPLSAYRGFFGSKPYSQANAFLEALGRQAVDWCTVSNPVKKHDQLTLDL